MKAEARSAMAPARRIRLVAMPLLLAVLVPAASSGSQDLASSTAAQDPPASQVAAAPEASLTPEPFRKHAVGVEFGLGILGEAWNLNEEREWLASGSAGVWWAFRDSATLLVELHHTRVFQHRPRHAFVQGLTPIVRWRLHTAPPWGLFVELGPGISWSDTQVPPRGTRFNYLLLAGTGVSRRVGRQTQAVAGFRWLHLSNNGREGRHRNPDIEALGAHAALTIAF